MTGNKKRIALFIPSFRGGGAEKVMLNLAHYFFKSSLDVDIVVVQASGPYLTQIDKGIRVVDLKAARVLLSLPRLINYLKKEKPVALISTLSHANIIAILAKYLARNKVELIIREATTISRALNDRNRLFKTMFLCLIKIFYPLADKVIAVSNGVADDLRKLISIPSEKLIVINNPLDFNEINSLLHEKDFTEELTNNTFPIILGVGRLIHDKGFDSLIEAFVTVRESIPAKLIILGEGNERTHLEQLIAAKGMENYILLPGFADNPYLFIKKAAVFVLSSRREGFPNVLLQALSCGCPVVCTDCQSGPAEILEDGRYGPLVPVDDPDALAVAILKVLDDPVKPEILIARSLQFSIDIIGKKYLDVINNL